VDWAVTTPLMILNLGLLAGEDTVMIAAVMGADVGMIVAGYLGAVALVPTVKWLWFIIGLAVFAPVVIALVRTFRQTVIDKNDVDRIELYGKVSLLTIVVWSLYPIVWFLGVGTGAIGVSLEAISFAILDVISKCVFSFMIVQLNVSPKPPIPSSAP
jgi:bacteriorhodopsin